MPRIHSNNYRTTLTADITNVATTMTVASVTGLPSIGAGTFCYLTLVSGSTLEIVKATSNASTTITIERGLEGTTGTAFLTGSYVSLRPTANSIDRKSDIDSPTFTGTVVLPSTTSIGTVSSTELGYVDGVTSAIQTQIDSKAPIASPTFTGTVTIPTPYTIGAVSMTATGTELNYVAGVTSAIQTQLNTKYGSGGTDVVVADGGTGRSSATAYAPIVGGTTSTGALQSTASAGSSGQLLASAGSSAVPVWTTPTYPTTSQTSGKILRSDGTNIAASTSTFADTYAVSTLLYASSANTVAGLATANSAMLVTNSSGVPSLTTSTFEQNVSFTPVFFGSTTAGTPTGTFAGKYTRIGSIVIVTVQAVFTSLDVMAGNLKMSALPYTIRAGSSNRSPVCVSFKGNFTNMYSLGGFGDTGATTVSFYNNEIDNSLCVIGDLTATTNIYFQLIYSTSD